MLKDSPRLPTEQITEFENRLAAVAAEVEEVAEHNILNIRKTRDQYFVDEIAGRIRKELSSYVSSQPAALFELLRGRIAEYIGLQHTSLF